MILVTIDEVMALYSFIHISILFLYFII